MLICQFDGRNFSIGAAVYLLQGQGLAGYNRSVNHILYIGNDDSALTFDIENIDRNRQTLHEFWRINDPAAEGARILGLQIWVASDYKGDLSETGVRHRIKQTTKLQVCGKTLDWTSERFDE